MEPSCQISITLDIIGGKWKGTILRLLLQETHRFNELRRLLPEITQKTLSTQLRELERDGFVHRQVFPTVPPRVDYSATALAKTLQPHLEALEEWEEQHRSEVLHAQKSYDERPTSKVL